MWINRISAFPALALGTEMMKGVVQKCDKAIARDEKVKNKGRGTGADSCAILDGDAALPQVLGLMMDLAERSQMWRRTVAVSMRQMDDHRVISPNAKA